MLAVTHFQYPDTPRGRWKARYHRLREKRQDIRFRAKVWQMMATGLLLFWALVAWGIRAVT